MVADVKKQEVTCYGCEVPVMLYDPETLPLLLPDLKANGLLEELKAMAGDVAR
jgi:hypothetical protein